MEIMGSEGYLINQFLVRHTNKRADGWGGEYEARMRFPVEVRAWGLVCRLVDGSYAYVDGGYARNMSMSVCLVCTRRS